MELVNEKLFTEEIFDEVLFLNLLECIDQEIVKADSIHQAEYDNLQWLSILTEEVGEVARALNELRINETKLTEGMNGFKGKRYDNPDLRAFSSLHKEKEKDIRGNLKHELIQVTATAIRFLRNIKNNEDGK